MSDGLTHVRAILSDQRTDLQADWIRCQLAAPSVRTDLQTEGERRAESDRFLQTLQQALQDDPDGDVRGAAWEPVRALLNDLSGTRAVQGFTPTETATFVLSLKQPLFERVQARHAEDPAALGASLWAVSQLLDEIGLLTTEAYLRSREGVIRRQQDELLELSTPVVRLWQGVVAMPLIGTLDSARTQVVMENLLESIVTTDSTMAIIDITGVPTVDTLVAQHLLKTVAAARLMGADCIISGIRPAIAQTVVHLGLDLSGVTTKASLADAVSFALDRTGFHIARKRAIGD